jgi:hypothetical protein
MPTDPLETTPAHSRSWLRALAVPIILFALGGVAIAWLLTQTQAGRDFVSPPAPQVASQPPGTVKLMPVAPAPALVPPAISVDVATRIASLEARLAQLEARGGGSSGSSRADSLFTLLAARRALEHGSPLGGIETELTNRFGNVRPRAVSAVLAAARQPSSLAMLTQQLRDLAPALAGVAPDDGWWSKFTGAFSNLVVVRDASTPGGDPALRLENAQKLLAAGQVEAAISQISALPERARAADWMAAARRYAEAQQALDELDEAALAPAMPTTAPVPPPTLVIPPPATVVPKADKTVPTETL